MGIPTVKRIALICLFALALCGHAHAQCDNGNPWATQFGNMVPGDVIIYGPNCNQFQDGGPSPAGSTTTPISGATNVLGANCGTRFLPTVTNTQLLYAITFPSVGSITGNCQISVTAPSNRGVILGGAIPVARILWPMQSITYVATPTGWIITAEPGLYQLTGGLDTTHVNHTSGTDWPANDCLGTGAGACKTVFGAANVFQSQVLCNGFQPFVQVDDTSFTENTSLNGVRCPGVNNLQIVGNPSNPDNAVWLCNAAGVPCLNVSDHATVVVNGFNMQCSVSGAIEFQINQGGLLAFENIDFGICGGGIHINCAATGQIVYEGGTYVISATTFLEHVVMTGPCSFNPGGGTVNIPNVMTFANFYIVNGSGAHIETGLTYTGAGAGAASSGRQYLVEVNGSLILSGTTVPGATPGATSSGGTVVP
jgi:hypothetical protein